MATLQKINSIEKIWESLGTFWGQFPEKDFYSAVWESYRGISQEMLRRRYQLYLSKYLEYMPAIMTHQYESYEVILSGVNQNTYTTSGHITIDIGDYIESIPQLEGIHTNQVLSEDTDYEIVDGNRLQFLSSLTWESESLSVANRTTLYADTIYYNNPVLWEVYASGIDLSIDSFSNENYLPATSLPASGIDRTKKVAKHFKYLVWGLYEMQRRNPTIKNLKTAFGMSRGVPFAYHNGTIDNINGQTITIQVSGITNTYDTYVLPSGVTLPYTINDTVNRFDLLASGIHLYDNVNNSNFISQLDDVNAFNIQSRIQFTYDTSLKNLDYHSNFHNRYIKNLVPDYLTYGVQEE